MIIYAILLTGMISIKNESHKAWSSTSSSDNHHMVGINKLIQQTSLLEVRLLIEVLKARENDLLRIQPRFANSLNGILRRHSMERQKRHLLNVD
jgi:hypothetical protein